jgi:hypothetical protein
MKIRKQKLKMISRLYFNFTELIHRKDDYLTYEEERNGYSDIDSLWNAWILGGWCSVL